jgi:hypothetical protein
MRPILIAIAIAALCAAAPATALEGFTGVQDQNWFLAMDDAQCLYTGGNGELFGCTKHTFTFVSSNDCCGNAYTCARLYNRLDHSLYEGHCGFNLARHCRNGDGSGLDCTDQDHTSYHAGATNQSSGSTFLIRGRF